MIVYPTVRFILKLVYMYNVEQLQAALICSKSFRQMLDFRR